jgi:membrane-bound lytic murein transglycosylase A
LSFCFRSLGSQSLSLWLVSGCLGAPLGLGLTLQACAQSPPAPAQVSPTPAPSPVTLPTPPAPASPPPTAVPSGEPLRLVAAAELPLDLGRDAQLWRQGSQPGDRPRLLAAVDNSLRYLQDAKALEDYRNYSAVGRAGQLFAPFLGTPNGLDQQLRMRVVRSLRRFRQLIVQSSTPEALQAAVKREFAFFQAVGKDNAGGVSFTGYYEAVYTASPVRTNTYRYPLYRLPADFKQWPQPHPSRVQLEGADGLLGPKSRLKGLELVWLRDRLEAFLVHIQGSAKLQLTNGRTMTVGYAGKTNYPYTSLGQELIRDGKLEREGLTLPKVLHYFRQNPLELNTYIPRNQSFVFFSNTQGGPPTGSIRVPVTPERSIATDKSLMPPGALALVQVAIPYRNAQGQLEPQLVSRFVLDQDTGSAIKGPGRVDIFMGTGPQAKARAGLLNTPGRLYYLLLK